jgi:asparagine synthetase B (glutamine-hydrolysing)
LAGVSQIPFGLVVSDGPSGEHSELDYHNTGCNVVRGGSLEKAQEVSIANREGRLIEYFDRLIKKPWRHGLRQMFRLGCLLSGGVDSSLVAVHAARRIGNIDHRLRADAVP